MLFAQYKAPPRSPISSWYSQLKKNQTWLVISIHKNHLSLLNYTYKLPFKCNMNEQFFFFNEKESPSTQEVYNGNPSSFCWMKSSSLHMITYIFNLHHLEYWICSERALNHIGGSTSWKEFNPWILTNKIKEDWRLCVAELLPYIFTQIKLLTKLSYLNFNRHIVCFVAKTTGLIHENLSINQIHTVCPEYQAQIISYSSMQKYYNTLTIHGEK